MSELDIASLWISSMAAMATVVASWAALRGLAIQTSPDIIMYVRPDDVSPSQARLVIRNIGEAPAYNVVFRLSPDLFVNDSFEYTRASVVFDRGYAILPLNRRGTFSWEGSRTSKDCGGTPLST